MRKPGVSPAVVAGILVVAVHQENSDHVCEWNGGCQAPRQEMDDCDTIEREHEGNPVKNRGRYAYP